jgi:hypothetical protein
LMRLPLFPTDSRTFSTREAESLGTKIYCNNSTTENSNTVVKSYDSKRKASRKDPTTWVTRINICKSLVTRMIPMRQSLNMGANGSEDQNEQAGSWLPQPQPQRWTCISLPRYSAPILWNNDLLRRGQTLKAMSWSSRATPEPLFGIKDKTRPIYIYEAIIEWPVTIQTKYSPQDHSINIA